MLDRDWLDGLIDGLQKKWMRLEIAPPEMGLLIGGACKLRDAILAAPEPPSAPAPCPTNHQKGNEIYVRRQCWVTDVDGEAKVGEELAFVRPCFCPDCGAALDDKGER